jgi:phosphoglycolate phosphatase
MKKLIIFDMDGTLVDSSLTLARAINSVRKNLGLKSMDEKHILSKVNEVNLNPAQYFYETKNFTAQHEEWFASYYTQNHEKELRLYEGVGEFLDELREKGYLLALATNAYRVSALQSLSYLKITEKFSAVACHDDVAEGKPSPLMLYKILEELDIKNSETIFIGDGERDELASKNANIDYIMVSWGFSEHENNNKKTIVHNIKKLKEKILEL